MVSETVRFKVKSQKLLGAFFMYHLRVEGISEEASESSQAHSLKPFHFNTDP